MTESLLSGSSPTAAGEADEVADAPWSIEPDTHATVFPPNWLYPSNIQASFPKPARPLTLDLGAGKGRFLLAHAAAHPDRNILGLERQLRRVRKMDRKIHRAGLTNVRLFRMEGVYTLRYLLPAASVDRCFIFFPDPWPKSRHAHHRILGPAFLDDLLRVLTPAAELHVATDHLPYFYAVADLLLADPRFQEIPAFQPTEAERTDFELRYASRKPIGRISMRRKNAPQTDCHPLANDSTQSATHWQPNEPPKPEADAQ